MTMNLTPDDPLMNEELKAGEHKTKHEAATPALESDIKARRREGIHDLIGKIEFHDDFDHKSLRR